jgi:predicted O-methyltransferase YrrM
MLTRRVIQDIKASVRSGPAAPYIDRLLVSVPSVYPLLRYESQLSTAQLDVLLRLLDADVPGDIVECGVYRGGTTALMARHLQRRGVTTKTIHALDSFSGFRTDSVEVEIRQGLEAEAREAFRGTSPQYLRHKLQALGLAHLVRVVPGYFENTLESVPGPFSLALIDCDLEGPVYYCLTVLWDRMSPGGHLIVDDYVNTGYPGARHAAQRFLEGRTDAEATPEGNFLVLRRRTRP